MDIYKKLFSITIIFLFLVQLSAPALGAELKANDVEAIKKSEGEFVSVVGDVYSTYKAPSGKVRFLNFGPTIVPRSLS